MLRILIILWLCFYSLFTFANDSAGTVGAGGIHFQKTSGVVMEQELLKISPQKVEVIYQFKNITDQPITTTVFFPLPVYKMKGALASWDTEVEPEASAAFAPFLNFSVTVDNKKIPYRTIIRAVQDNHDITNKLKAAQIPLNPDLVAGQFPVPESTPVKQWQAQAKKLGLLNDQNKPLWQKQILYAWTLTFPAKQAIKISHSYRPATGSFFGFRGGMLKKSVTDYLNDDRLRMKDLFGIDLNDTVNGDVFSQWLTTRIQNAENPTQEHCINFQKGQTGCMYALFYNVDYILKTGANWEGPIKHFELVLTHPNMDVIAYNKFYGTAKAITKKEQDTLTIALENFTPKQDLQVLFGSSKPSS